VTATVLGRYAPERWVAGVVVRGGLVGGRGGEDGRVGARRPDDLQPDRQAVRGEAAAYVQRGQPGVAGRLGEPVEVEPWPARDLRPVDHREAAIGIVREGRSGGGGGEQQVVVLEHGRESPGDLRPGVQGGAHILGRRDAPPGLG
jgi:hypothetical protein